MYQPLLSIIIPVFNGASYLEATVSSIIRHNHGFDYEILLVDDGSSDDSYSLCQRLAASNPVIRVFHRGNQGIAPTRDFGLKESSGRYLCFFDQDDQCISSYLPFLQLLDASVADLLIADYCQGDIVHYHRQGHIPQTIVGDEEYAHALVRHLVSPRCLCSAEERRLLPSYFGTIWNCIFRASFVQKHRLTIRAFFDFEDDWVFCIDCLSRTKRVALTTDAFYCHVVNDASESYRHKYLPHFALGRAQLWQWLITRLADIGINAALTEKAQAEYQKDTVLWGFYNSCILPQHEYLQVMRERSDLSSPYRLMSRLVLGPIELLFLSLIRFRFYRLSRIINRVFFKFSYH